MGILEDIIYGIAKAVGYAHPIHPVLTHLVIGPVLVAFVFAVLGWIFMKPTLRHAARLLTVFAFVLWFFTFAMGLIDWRHFYGGSLAIFEIRMKLILAGVLFLLLLATIALNRRLPEGSRIPLILYTLSALTVIGLGYYGGSLVFGSRTPSASAVGSPAAAPATAPGGFKSVQKEGFTFEWKVNGPNLDVRIGHAGTGWVGVGFGHTGTMEGSDIQIGYVKDGKATVIDTFGDGPNRHPADVDLGGRSDVTNVSGSIEGGATHIEFTIPLRSGDRYDMTLTPGESYLIIMAHGPNAAADDVTYHGSGVYVRFTITL